MSLGARKDCISLLNWEKVHQNAKVKTHAHQCPKLPVAQPASCDHQDHRCLDVSPPERVPAYPRIGVRFLKNCNYILRFPSLKAPDHTYSDNSLSYAV